MLTLPSHSRPRRRRRWGWSSDWRACSMRKGLCDCSFSSSPPAPPSPSLFFPSPSSSFFLLIAQEHQACAGLLTLLTGNPYVQGALALVQQALDAAGDREDVPGALPSIHHLLRYQHFTLFPLQAHFLSLLPCIQAALQVLLLLKETDGDFAPGPVGLGNFQEEPDFCTFHHGQVTAFFGNLKVQRLPGCA